MTGFAEYGDDDALGLARLVGDGAVRAAELLEAALARLEALNPRLNAVSIRLEQMAHKAIEAGLPDGPFTSS